MQIVIDRSTFRLSVLDNGVAFATFPVGLGRPSAPTPEGHWRVDSLHWPDPDQGDTPVIRLNAPGEICLRPAPGDPAASLGRAVSGG